MVNGAELKSSTDPAHFSMLLEMLAKFTNLTIFKQCLRLTTIVVNVNLLMLIKF